MNSLNLSKLSKEEKELVEDWALLTEPDERCLPKGWGEAQFMDTAPAILSIRDEIAERGLDKLTEVKETDIRLLKQVLEYGSDPPAEDGPFEKWWWQLHKIAERTYPPELLPDYLREIYEKELNK